MPKRPDSLKLACHKFSKRFEDDISTVCLVLAIEHAQGGCNARCAMNTMAAIPKRAAHMKQKLNTQPLQVSTFIDAATALNDDFAPMSDVRSALYRTTVAKTCYNVLVLSFCGAQPQCKNNNIAITRISHTSHEKWINLKAQGGSVGQSRKHHSAIKQVCGNANYADDNPEPHGLTHAYPVLAPITSGFIKSIDTSKSA
ncbi:hypothetical protein ACOBV9_18750 (plasmid) [Pseudoalteromonas espejiana]